MCMSQEQPTLRSRLINWLRFHLATTAMRYCGPELLYWLDRERWEEFLQTGQDRTIPEDVHDSILLALLHENVLSDERAQAVREWLYMHRIEDTNEPQPSA